MSIIDTLTGGKNGAANAALQEAINAFKNIKAPSIQDMTLPQLQKYVEQGILTPEQAKAVLIQKNAFNDIKTDPAAREAQMKALNFMQGVGAEGGLTPTMRAQLLEATNAVDTQERGANASILDQMAQRGIPTSLLSPAAMMESNAVASRTANKTATDAAAQAEMNALRAMESSGTMGANIRGQDFSEQAAKAEAENAINKWNAENQTGVNLVNTGANNNAQAMNLGNKQDISNKNVGNTNTRTAYNANLPQTVFNNEMARASGMAGAYKAKADELSNQGKQSAGFWSGVVSAASPAIGSAFKGVGSSPGTGFDPSTMSNPPAGFTPYADGGPVKSLDNPANDKIPAMLSKNEIVLPRSVTMAPNAPDLSKQFVQHILNSKKPVNPIHHDDIKAVLEVLTSRRAA